jgi:hypothetical protein
MMFLALLAPERPITWVSWLIWAMVCVFAFPPVAKELASRTQHSLPYISWAQVTAGFDPCRESTFKGTIKKIHLFPFLNEATAVGVEIGRGRRSTLVLIGPRDFLSAEGIIAGPGQVIEGRGSRMLWRRGALILAREIVVQGRCLKLRDEGGQPLWTVADPAPDLARNS